MEHGEDPFIEIEGILRCLSDRGIRNIFLFLVKNQIAVDFHTLRREFGGNVTADLALNNSLLVLINTGLIKKSDHSYICSNLGYDVIVHLREPGYKLAQSIDLQQVKNVVEQIQELSAEQRRK